MLIVGIKPDFTHFLHQNRRSLTLILLLASILASFPVNREQLEMNLKQEIRTMNTTNLQHFPTMESGQSGVAHRASEYLQSLANTHRVWRQRSQTRRSLRTLSEQHLSDVGISRTEAGVEADKPFWRI